MKYKEIVIGDVCSPPRHFNEYEFIVQFDTGDCCIFTVKPADGLATANLLGQALDVGTNEAYELLKPLDLTWPLDHRDDLADLADFTMYYYNFRGIKRHVILK